MLLISLLINPSLPSRTGHSSSLCNMFPHWLPSSFTLSYLSYSSIQLPISFMFSFMLCIPLIYKLSSFLLFCCSFAFLYIARTFRIICKTTLKHKLRSTLLSLSHTSLLILLPSSPPNSNCTLSMSKNNTCLI